MYLSPFYYLFPNCFCSSSRFLFYLNHLLPPLSTPLAFLPEFGCNIMVFPLQQLLPYSPVRTWHSNYKHGPSLTCWFTWLIICLLRHRLTIHPTLSSPQSQFTWEQNPLEPVEVGTLNYHFWNAEAQCWLVWEINTLHEFYLQKSPQVLTVKVRDLLPAETAEN